MRPIGFSTGALAGADFSLALLRLQDESVDSVELSALRYPELSPLLHALSSLGLKKYHYISIHAPSSFTASQEAEIVELLRQFVPRDWPIVLHPDTIHDFALWRAFGAQLAIENMDRRKSIGRTADELSQVFASLPEASLCFDIGHARQCDTTMTEAYRILRAFSGRLRQLHVSEVNTGSRHDPLSYAAILAFAEVAPLIPERVPIILESRVAPDQIEQELERAQRALSTQTAYAVPAY
jgi:hypothetical protein